MIHTGLPFSAPQKFISKVTVGIQTGGNVILGFFKLLVVCALTDCVFSASSSRILKLLGNIAQTE
jgi:hypothetical protein